MQIAVSVWELHNSVKSKGICNLHDYVAVSFWLSQNPVNRNLITKLCFVEANPYDYLQT